MHDTLPHDCCYPKGVRAGFFAITGAACLLGAVVLIACGAATDPLILGGPDASTTPLDAGSDSGDSAPAQDTGADVTVPDEAGPPCDGDADYDAALCVPPSDDQLIADPPVVTVPAGSYGIAQFKATGPWATDPNMWIGFESATVSLQSMPFALPNQPPTGFLFQVATASSDVQGTLTAVGHDGNIERTATLKVIVTGCQPWDEAMACQSYDCGYQGDNCGGLVDCGKCSGATPYCFLGSCVATAPTYCPNGQGYDPQTGCIPCMDTRTCFEYCRDGRCTGLQDECFCAPWSYPPCPPSPPIDGNPCGNLGQVCTYNNTCYESYSSICELAGAWSTPPIPTCQ